MKTVLLVIALSLCSCTGVATVARPIQGTISPLEYDEAETAFSGTTDDWTNEIEHYCNQTKEIAK